MAKVRWVETTPDNPIYREGPQVFIPVPRPSPLPAAPRAERLPDDRRDDDEGKEDGGV